MAFTPACWLLLLWPPFYCPSKVSLGSILDPVALSRALCWGSRRMQRSSTYYWVKWHCDKSCKLKGDEGFVKEIELHRVLCERTAFCIYLYTMKKTTNEHCSLAGDNFSCNYVLNYRYSVSDTTKQNDFLWWKGTGWLGGVWWRITRMKIED